MERSQRPGFGTDFRVFRQYPLMNLGGGQHLILDLQFLEELLVSGIFFHLLSRQSEQGRQTLLDLWGRIFELLATELIEHYYPRSSGVFLADYSFSEKLPDGLKQGQLDGLLDFGRVVILFEFKHFFLSQNVKDAMDRAELERKLLPGRSRAGNVRSCIR